MGLQLEKWASNGRGFQMRWVKDFFLQLCQLMIGRRISLTIIFTGYSYPYVVAILPKYVEVRNVETQALVQQVELHQARILNQGKLLYIASSTTVWRLTPFSFSRQVSSGVQKS